MVTKDALRKQFDSLRLTLSPVYRKSAHDSIYHKVISHPHIVAAKTVCCYISHESEVDTHRIIEYCLKENKQVVVPKVADKRLDLHAITSLEECTPGFKGILEPPSTNRLVAAPLVDLFIVLGLVFDTYKYRIGYGKGYTDRLLASQSGIKMGLAYTDQLISQVPHESHDVPLDVIITDTITLL